MYFASNIQALVLLAGCLSIECKDSFSATATRNNNPQETHDNSHTTSHLGGNASTKRALQEFTIVDSSNLTASDLVATIVPPDDRNIETANHVFTGHPQCAGLFYNARQAVDDPTINFPDTGFVLSTGDVNGLIGQDGTCASTDFGFPGDPDVSIISTYDACALEFDFRCNNDQNGPIVIEYNFASDEYREQVTENLGFADRFRIFLNGEIKSLVPGTNDIEVSVYSINDSPGSYGWDNRQYFVFNNPRLDNARFPNFEPDGFTIDLTAVGESVTGWNKVKMVIADVLDPNFDSYLFVSSATMCPPAKTAGSSGGGKYSYMSHLSFVRIQHANTHTLHSYRPSLRNLQQTNIQLPRRMRPCRIS